MRDRTENSARAVGAFFFLGGGVWLLNSFRDRDNDDAYIKFLIYNLTLQMKLKLV